MIRFASLIFLGIRKNFDVYGMKEGDEEQGLNIGPISIRCTKVEEPDTPPPGYFPDNPKFIRKYFALSSEELNDLPEIVMDFKITPDGLEPCTFEVVSSDDEDEDYDDDYSDQASLAVYLDINDLKKKFNKISEKKIYTCLFVDEDDESSNPMIQSLFCYARIGKQIVFNCIGLTDNSSGDPMAQCGLIDFTDSLTVWGFEEYDSTPIEDELYRSDADEENGEGLYEAIEPDEPLELSDEAIAMLEKTDDYLSKCYDIDEESDEGNYRVTDDFFSKHQKQIQDEGCWIEKGFCREVYQAAESVLQTGAGFLF